MRDKLKFKKGKTVYKGCNRGYALEDKDKAKPLI